VAGLIDSLDGLLSVQVDLSVSAGNLGAVTDAVSALRAGPDVLGGLRQAIAALPLPPGLEGVAQLSTNLDNLPGLLTLDTAAALAPVLGPIAGLSLHLEVSATGSIGGIVELLRAGLSIATGRQHGGAQGMPSGAELPQQQKPSFEEIRQAATEARAALQALGPFDAPTLLERLMRAASGFRTPLVRFIPLPLVDDLMQPLATVESWRTMNGAQLAASLGQTLGTLAQVLDLPSTRIGQPVLDASARIQAAVDGLPQLVLDVRALARPEATLAQRQAVRAALTALAEALDADSGPFSALRELPNDLVQARLVAVRAVEPPMNLGPLMAQMRTLIAGIPHVEGNPLEDVVDGIAAFDLSILTDAMAAVRGAIDDAVKAAEDGRQAVRDALTGLLQPVDQAVAAAVDAFDPSAINTALEAVPAQFQTFLESNIEPAIAPLRDAIAQAVTQISAAAENFDPSALIQPIREKMEAAAKIVNDPAVASAFAEVERVLQQMFDAVSSIDLSGATDEVIGLLGDIEDKLRKIDPGNIPDPVKPPLREAVSFLTGIDFQAELGKPIDEAGQKVAAGGAVALREIEEGLEDVRGRVEKFRPSVIIAGTLGAPFAGLKGQLEDFCPSQLFGALSSELHGLAQHAHVLDSATILAPLRQALATVTHALDSIRPGALLEPVNKAIDKAIADVLAASHLNQVFDGITDIVGEVQAYVGLANDLRAVLEDAAAMFGAPGDGEQAVQQFVEEALDRLDPLDIAALAAAFDAVAAANERNQRSALAGRIAPALRSADSAAQALAAHAQLGALGAAVDTLAGDAETRAAHAGFRKALGSWQQVRDDIGEVAGALFERLEDYQLAEIIDGGSVLDPLMQRPATIPALKAAIRPALEEAVREPLLTLNAALQAISPYLAGMSGGLAALIGAAHAKVDAITGAQGVGGVVDSVDTLVDQLRNLDLTPISDPLDAVFGRLEAGVAKLAPDGLAVAIDGANAAIEGLFDLGRLIPADQISALDGQYRGAVQRLLQLDPSVAISAELDPVFETLMANVLPLFDLPKRLRAISDAAVATLTTSLKGELAKVEAKFDEMLHAIPLQDTGTPGASVSVSASVAVG